MADGYCIFRKKNSNIGIFQKKCFFLCNYRNISLLKSAGQLALAGAAALLLLWTTPKWLRSPSLRSCCCWSSLQSPTQSHISATSGLFCWGFFLSGSVLFATFFAFFAFFLCRDTSIRTEIGGTAF